MQSYGSQTPNAVCGDSFVTSANCTVARDVLEQETGSNDSGAKGKVYATVMAIVPFFFFCMQLATVFLFYHKYMVGTFIAFAVAVVVAFALSLFKHERKLHYIGILCNFGTLSGQCIGQYVYYSTMIYYYSYNDMGKYTNVGASQPALQFADAGMLLFTSDTRVDSTRAVGFRSIKEARNMCVAPIVDPGMGENAKIYFWAVGINCCEPRASFNCDSAQDSTARSGLLMLQPDMLVAPSMEWAVSPDGLEGFTEAVQAQNKLFASQVPDDLNKIRFVRWTKDPIKLQDEYWYHGIHLCTLWSLVYFVLNTVAAIYLGVYKKGGPHKKEIEV